MMSSSNSSLAELIEKGYAALNDSYYEKAIEHYEKALNIAQDIGDKQGEGSSLDGLGMAYRSLGEIKKARKYHEQALDIARNTQNQWEESDILINLGNTYCDLGEMKKAIEYYEQALAITQDIGNREGESICLEDIGYAHMDLGEINKAIEYYEQALDIARDNGYIRIESDCLGHIGYAYKDLGEIKKAIQYLKKSLAIARDAIYRDGECGSLGDLGSAYKDLGETKKAIEYYEQSLRIARDIGDRWKESRILGNLGSAYKDLGEIKKAKEYYVEGLRLARDVGDRAGEGSCILSIGEVNLISGEWNTSLKLFSESLELFESTGNPTDQAEVLKCIGELQIKSGDWENARTNLNKSIKIYEKTIPHMIADVLVHVSELNILEDLINDASANLKNAFNIVSRYELNPKKIDILIRCGRVQLVKYERYNEKENIQKAKDYHESALKLSKKFHRPLERGISLREFGILYSKNNQKDKSYNSFKKSLEIFQKINARYELAETYFEYARALAENNEFMQAEEMAKVCAFDCLIRNFKALEIDTYMLLGDIIWKQDNSQFGYYLEAFEKAIFNTRIYVKIFFLLIKRTKKMDKKTGIEFIGSLKTINKEIQINSFLNSLLLKIQDEKYTTEGLPDELIMELNDFEIPKN